MKYSTVTFDHHYRWHNFLEYCETLNIADSEVELLLNTQSLSYPRKIRNEFFYEHRNRSNFMQSISLCWPKTQMD